MSIISTSTLFHYTKSLDKLVGILTNGFRYSVIEEVFPEGTRWGKSIYTSIGIHRTHVRNNVICFCDIPITQANDHRQSYGNYALGLNKEWAIANNFAPVRYICSDSPGFSGKLIEFQEIYKNKAELGNHFVGKYIKHFFNKDVNIDNLPEEAKFIISKLEHLIEDSLSFIMSGFPYFKSYENNELKNDLNNRRFYNEREWRSIKTDSDYLKFKWNDISFIICNKKDECEIIYNKLFEIKDLLFIDNVDRIWQKIQSFDNIEKNF